MRQQSLAAEFKYIDFKPSMATQKRVVDLRSQSG